MTDVPVKKSVFKPANDAHAIVETMVFCEFSPPLTPDLMERLQSLKEIFKDDVPVYKPLIQVAFRVDIANGGQPMAVTNNERGFELSSNPKDGVVDWVVRIDENAVSIHCLNYIRWLGFWEKTEKILTNILGLIKGGESFLTNLGLKVVDRFIYLGEEKDYQAENLFKNLGDLVPKHVLSSSPLWHSHMGWYDTPEGQPQVLNQLNIDSIYANINNEPKLTATIEHNGVYRLIDGKMKPGNLLSIVNAEGKTLLNQMASNLHVGNKLLLKSLLSEVVQEQINLGDIQK